MTLEQPFLSDIYEGWNTHQRALTQALAPLTAGQLDLRAVPRLRSVRDIATHIIVARARWFHLLMGKDRQDRDSFSAS